MRDDLDKARQVSSPTVRFLLYVALLILFVLHNDIWLWNDGSLVLGLPVGLTYHVLYCLATTALMGLLVRHAWPSGPGAEPGV